MNATSNLSERKNELIERVKSSTIPVRAIIAENFLEINELLFTRNNIRGVISQKDFSALLGISSRRLHTIFTEVKSEELSSPVTAPIAQKASNETINHNAKAEMLFLVRGE